MLTLRKPKIFRLEEFSGAAHALYDSRAGKKRQAFIEQLETSGSGAQVL